MARILIVEDDKYLNKLITDRFILEGFEVQSVLDGESAWDLLSRAQGSEKPFDVLLSDMLLPRLMGAQLFAKAQEVQKTHPLRLIAMSGIYKNPAETDEISRLYKIEKYWTKPFSLSDLVQFITHKESASEPADPTLDLPPGLLSDRSIERLFLDAYDLGFTGKLILKRDDSERRIYFSNGFPVSGDSTAISESFGRSLLALGLISQVTLEEASRQMVDEKLQFGQMLIKMGAITKEKLFEALRKHTYRILINSIGWRDGNYEFLPLKELPAHILALEFNSILLMMRAHRALYSSHFITTLFHTKLEFFCQFSERAFQILPLFNLDDGSLHFFQSFPGNETLSSVIKPIPASNHEMVFRVFYLLEALGLVEWKFAPTENKYKDVARADFSSTFETEKQASEAVAQSLQAEYMDLLNKDYVDLLEVTPESTPAEIEESYRALRYRLHPDRYGSNIGGQTKRILDDMLSRIDRAYQTLTDPELKEAYLASVQRLKEDSLSDSKKFLDAQDLFREGLRHLSTQDFAKAKNSFDSAYSKWDRGVEYRLYSLFSEFKLSLKKSPQEADGLLQKLKSEAAIHRAMDTSYLLLGHAYSALGDAELAKEAYQLALKNNEKNDEAANALVRLGEARLKQMKLSRVVSQSKSGIKRLFIAAFFIGAVVFAYKYRHLLKPEESGIRILNPKEIESSMPAISLRQKLSIAKIVLKEKWIADVPTPVLNSKCVEALNLLKTYGILELYIFDEKAGLKARCKGETLSRY